MKDIATPFFEALLQGDKQRSQALAMTYFEQKGGNLLPVYEDVIKEALYEVGRQWELNKISVATEHLASAISEAVLNQLFSKVAVVPPQPRSAVFTCVEKEQHEIGIKMVNDVFELHQWNCYYLGTSTPLAELMHFIEQVKPDVLAFSLSIYFNLPVLTKSLEQIVAVYPDLKIIVGGQAFNRGGTQVLKTFKNVSYIQDLPALEDYLNQYDK